MVDREYYIVYPVMVKGVCYAKDNPCGHSYLPKTIILCMTIDWAGLNRRS